MMGATLWRMRMIRKVGHGLMTKKKLGHCLGVSGAGDYIGTHVTLSTPP